MQPVLSPLVEPSAPARIRSGKLRLEREIVDLGEVARADRPGVRTTPSGIANGTGLDRARAYFRATSAVAHASIPPSELTAIRFLRVMSYNVHGCVGSDFRLDPPRVARVIADCAADVVALQELDMERSRSGRVDQPRALAEQLGMQLAFCSARECDGGQYGNAVLSRHPIEVMRAACLPRPAKRREQRAVQWVRVLAPGLPLNVVNTHLGLDHGERMQHAAAILGGEWVHEARALGPTVLCGDFNAGPRSAVYRKLTSELRDAQRLVTGRGPRGTFPSLLPLMRIDHVLVSPELSVRQCRVASGWQAKLASDHLPLVVDLSFERNGS